MKKDKNYNESIGRSRRGTYEVTMIVSGNPKEIAKAVFLTPWHDDTYGKIEKITSIEENWDEEKDNKDYILFVTEEVIMQEGWEGFRAGRVELWNEDSPYSIKEGRFFVPENMFRIFQKLDGVEVDLPIEVDLDFKREDC